MSSWTKNNLPLSKRKGSPFKSVAMVSVLLCWYEKSIFIFVFEMLSTLSFTLSIMDSKASKCSSEMVKWRLEISLDNLHKIRFHLNALLLALQCDQNIHEKAKFLLVWKQNQNEQTIKVSLQKDKFSHLLIAFRNQHKVILCNLKLPCKRELLNSNHKNWHWRTFLSINISIYRFFIDLEFI